MKYLKYFKTDVDCQNYFNSDDFVTPNVSYAEDANIMYYKPIKSANSTIYATFSATDDNKLAIANTSNVKSLKVNGNSVPFDSTYYFESNGKYEVEIELIDDSVINGVIIENGNMSFPMFSNGEVGSCLTNITIPDSVTSIGMFAFIGCSGLTSITIGNSVTSIGEGAFNSCFGLTSINIPDSVTSIGNRAFDSCLGLTSINIPDLVTSIGDGTFNGCSSLTSATIGNFVTSIGENAFSNCYSLTSINIPDSVTSIGRNAFSSCSGLTSINIPDSVTSIGQEAFYECSSLTSITIGNFVKSIGSRAFYNCSSLTSITIPDSVTSIGEYMFDGCSKLNEITCLATTAPSIVYQTFYNIKENGVLSVPAGSDYSSWMSTGDYYLGKYNWTKQEI